MDLSVSGLHSGASGHSGATLSRALIQNFAIFIILMMQLSLKLVCNFYYLYYATNISNN